MAQIINLNDYKATKQRQLIINIYQFFNENLDYKLDNILIDFDEAFIQMCEDYKIDSTNVDYFRLPIITFIVTSFINNSEISDYFPQGLVLSNKENKYMFRNTLIKVLETFDKNFKDKKNKYLIEEEINLIIEEGLYKLLKVIPQNIYLV
ncbi:hypothetical protein [Natronincola ferrireducens]|uniref:Uncharacterized protein n=1 Tax=Natronincola ferrireducens TaxID=393762 RepID=A0A1G9A5H8_9FIRM|nr:hypothetical protein [Natronincola ferrireducens]SDK22471.1 hypothetical protein SAMN05660472_01063 [Natronincola ferrireducens]